MKKIATLIILSVFTSACAANIPVGLPQDNFGEAVRFNAAAEIVNPAGPSDRGPLTFDAQRAALQQGRYVRDTVEHPVDTATSEIATASSGGNGDGGGGGAGTGAATQ